MENMVWKKSVRLPDTNVSGSNGCSFYISVRSTEDRFLCKLTFQLSFFLSLTDSSSFSGKVIFKNFLLSFFMFWRSVDLFLMQLFLVQCSLYDTIPSKANYNPLLITNSNSEDTNNRAVVKILTCLVCATSRKGIEHSQGSWSWLLGKLTSPFWLLVTALSTFLISV